MHKGIVLVCLWAVGESSYIPDNGQFVHPHIHVPQNENVSLDAADEASQSGLKIVSGASDVHLLEMASKIGNIHYLHTIHASRNIMIYPHSRSFSQHTQTITRKTRIVGHQLYRNREGVAVKSSSANK